MRCMHFCPARLHPRVLHGATRGPLLEQEGAAKPMEVDEPSDNSAAAVVPQDSAAAAEPAAKEDEGGAQLAGELIRDHQCMQ